MEYYKIMDDEGGVYHISQQREFTNVNPIEYYERVYKSTKTSLLKALLECKLQQLGIKNEIDEKEIITVASQEASELWKQKLIEINKIEIPNEIKRLFKSESKKEQVRLLKNFKLEANDLLAYYFYAFSGEGYLLSQYIGEHYPEGVDPDKLPILTHVKKDEVVKIGDTDYADGKLKQIIDHQTRTVAKILERNDEWHCFFITHKSISGKEAWKGGQPHFHYISDKFGIAQEKLIEEIQSKKYKLGNLPHIDFVLPDTYRL